MSPKLSRLDISPRIAIHQQGYCTTCDWTARYTPARGKPWWSTVGKAAKAHVRETGHRVWIETETAQSIKPELQEPPTRTY